MQTAIMKLKDIRPAAYNPRVVLKPGDAEWESLKNSLGKFGLVEPLVFNKTTGNLVSGHQRLNVLKTSGAEEAEVVIIEVDEEKEKLLNIALNKIDGDWDYKKLEALFDEIDSEDIKFTGFTPDELYNLFDGEIPEDEDDDEEESNGSTDSGEKDSKEADPENPPELLKEFHIFLSFPTKDLAEKWLKDRGVEAEYQGMARNITIRMEGIDYGTGN
ncbi:MAG: ParB N-terminal domain-containing protein [Clostridia bacterium]|nr:ParB N-terminal domain-containing protein [Clostridia bacterium]